MFLKFQTQSKKNRQTFDCFETLSSASFTLKLELPWKLPQLFFVFYSAYVYVYVCLCVCLF